MNPTRLGIGLAVAMAIGQGAAPPYYGVVADSGGRLHASLGHRPRWAPPSPHDVCAAIRARQRQAPFVSCPPGDDRRAHFEARINVVRLVIEGAAGATVVAAVAGYSRRRRSGPTRHAG